METRRRLSRPRRMRDRDRVCDQYMSEGRDAATLSLPGKQDALISAVAKANPKTIVVLETGGPVAMPWA